MQKVYLDNAATTPLSPEVKAAMVEAMELFGNPSSTHEYGRKSKILIEKTRGMIAKTLHCAPGEIFFTSGGTEADNIALITAVRDLGVKRIITSPIEHHAVGHTSQYLKEHDGVEVLWLKVDENGQPDLDQLSALLQDDSPTMVSLMYANNEIGNLLDLAHVSKLCKENDAYFHSDTVQGIGHFDIDVEKTPIDFMACAAHKFHGPKGIGFVYIKGGVKVSPLIHGGGQERNMRAGTENIIGIAGLGKAFEEAYKNLEEDTVYIKSLKAKAIAIIETDFPEISFNGLSGSIDQSNYTVLSLSIPKSPKTEMLLFNMDMKGIAVSGGSACNSGSDKGSHVIDEIRKGKEESMTIRLSFSKYSTESELDYFFEALKQFLE